MWWFSRARTLTSSSSRRRSRSVVARVLTTLTATSRPRNSSLAHRPLPLIRLPADREAGNGRTETARSRFRATSSGVWLRLWFWFRTGASSFILDRFQSGRTGSVHAPTVALRASGSCVWGPAHCLDAEQLISHKHADGIIIVLQRARRLRYPARAAPSVRHAVLEMTAEKHHHQLPESTMTTRHSIAVIAGDGIGNEVVPAAIECLEKIAASMAWTSILCRSAGGRTTTGSMGG